MFISMEEAKAKEKWEYETEKKLMEDPEYRKMYYRIMSGYYAGKAKELREKEGIRQEN